MQKQFSDKKAMYKALFDSRTGGVILQTVSAETGWTDLRPVFFEELDILKLNQQYGWQYPHCEEPLLWSDQAHNYYFQGQKVAKARASGYFHRPEIVEAERNIVLQPVDLAGMRERNLSQMEALAQEAVAFIRKTVEDYQKKATANAVVAFSGGKDSLVLLDLVRRGLAPSQFIVIFNDTDMELAATYAAVKQAKMHWDDIIIHTTHARFPAEKSWRMFGPPSRIHRWCCYVHKSVPTHLYMKKYTDLAEKKILLFDGVRSEESVRRSYYDRITIEGKKPNQINACPLLLWNETEVYLYLLAHGIFFNRAYRYGMMRVGCSLCPFGSSWKDSMLYVTCRQDCRKLEIVLAQYARACGKKTNAEIQDFITGNAWAARAGGRFLFDGKNKCSIIRKKNSMNIQISSMQMPLHQWLKTLGRLEILSEKKMLVSHKKAYITLDRDNDNFAIAVFQAEYDARIFAKITKCIKKAAYCVACGACDAVCPKNAIDTEHKIVYEDRCIHCGKCLKIISGCLAARSLWISGGNIVQGLSRYQTFGMQTEWLETFFRHPDDWTENHGLGSRQFEAMKIWMKEAEFFDGHKITPLALLLARLPVDNLFVWEILWGHLAQHSALIHWYLEQAAWGERLSKTDLIQRAGESLSEKTRINAMSALVYLLAKTPLGSMGLGEVSRTKEGRVIDKKGMARFAQDETLLYLLARKAAAYGIGNCALAEFQQDAEWGPETLFGVPIQENKAALARLADRYPDLLHVEFVKNLDNVFLNAAAKPEEIIRRVLSRQRNSLPE